MKIDDMKKRFYELYGSSDERVHVFYAPGRVNLIGEHTDYNGGYVFPCALSFGTYGAIRKRNDSKIGFSSNNFDLKATTVSQDIKFSCAQGWTNYPMGIIKMFIEKGFYIGGFDILYDGNIPNGAGLSSSASIELVTSIALKTLFNCNIDMLSMVKLSQKAENEFVGVNCGIMDQFAIGMGKKDHAMLLNCGTMEYSYIPLILEGCKLVIANTNKRRGLTDSKYNERRAECERAVEYLNKKLSINFLCEIDPHTFEEYKYLIEEDNVCKRAAHVIYENKRALDAVDKLNGGDLNSFGKLMNESHRSLRDLYEVTGIELDTLVSEAWNMDGVIGSRMTGAGFGGCTVSIVKNDCVEEFKSRVGENYKQKVGLEAEFYSAGVGDGAKEIQE